MASRQIQFIDHPEKALVRIENKTYGICRVTGKLMDKARLRAVPHATLSIEAKLARQSKKKKEKKKAGMISPAFFLFYASDSFLTFCFFFIIFYLSRSQVNQSGGSQDTRLPIPLMPAVLVSC